MWIRAGLICLLIAVVETVHGILRVRFLNRRLGDHRARQAGVFTGSLLILLIAWLTVPWIDPRDASTAWGIGLLWLVGLLAFEIAIGRWAFRLPWSRIAADFDVRRGGLLGFGLLVLAAAPRLMAAVHGMF